MFWKRKKKPVRHDDNESFQKLLFEARRKYKGDYLRQLQYMKEKGNKQSYIMGLLTIAQLDFSLSSNHGKEIKFEVINLDYLYRGILDAVRHMQEDLPEGVYDYIQSGIETFVLKSLEQVDKTSE
ncbi:MAG: hypothetical protein MJA31_07330 [Clostridia bacterium]|nr:hypothetical protein [Clostridia bacterium]